MRPPIIENNEPLVMVEPIVNRLYIEASYYRQGIVNSLSSIYLRKQAYERLVEVANLLPQAYSLIVYDGFRPLQVQQALFEQIQQEITDNYPHFTAQQIQQETIKYVAFPSMAAQYPAPHLTGGAVDVVLGDSEGQALDFGTSFDETSAKSATAYFEQHATENPEALHNRRLLFHVMHAAGFQNYEEEWWHYDFGNATWARKLNESHAMYGPIISKVEQHELKEYRFK